MNETTLRAIQATLRDEGADAWFFASFKGSDPIAPRVLGLSEAAMVTRRWFCLIPRMGEPLKLCHRIEPHSLDSVPGRLALYGRWQEWQEELRGALKGITTVAVQYSENGVIPSLGRLDAGLAEFLRSCGVKLVSSGDLVARFDVTCTREQEGSHYRAMEVLLGAVDYSFSRVRKALASGEALTEYSLQREILAEMDKGGLMTDAPPIVAVGPHAADPHYEPSAEGSSPIGKDQVLLIDLWGKEKTPDAVYADITWCAWTGVSIPEEVSKVFAAVCQARDAAIARAHEVSHRAVAGWEVDRAARDTIEKAGYGEFFIHRTGHSIYTEDHANGANMDDFETRDTRRLLPNTLFSIEPGIYLPGRFGFRSEVNLLVTTASALVTGRKQGELPALGGESKG